MSADKMTVGFKNIHFAVMQEDVRKGETTYGAPKYFAGAMQATLNPNASSQTVHVDDVPVATVTSTGVLEMELQVDSISKEAAAELFGYRIDANGVLLEATKNKSPYIALGFESESIDGGKLMNWMYKGKLTVPSQEFQTKGESVEIKNQSVTGQFVNRLSDGEKKVSVHSNDEGINQEVILDWFDEVYKPVETTVPPTV
ncbi:MULTISPECIES: major tail protein [unclassified Priestia]|uniref:major tail protein n=1 Tax=unclassified Priestia TaxID=2800374 RepID=UPI00367030B0